MFWESKLAELKKLGSVALEYFEGDKCYHATIDGAINGRYEPGMTASGIGFTKAAAVCELWNMTASGGEPFTLETEQGLRLLRWNGRWEDLEIPKPEIKAPVVEEGEANAFDPAD